MSARFVATDGGITRVYPSRCGTGTCVNIKTVYKILCYNSSLEKSGIKKDPISFYTRFVCAVSPTVLVLIGQRVPIRHLKHWM